MHFGKYDKYGSDYHWKWWANTGGHYHTWTMYAINQLPEEGDGATVLDFGSGDGVPAHVLAKRGYVVTGVEPHDAARETARERVPLASFSPTYEGGVYDYVFCLETIEHVDDPTDLVQAVLQCREYAIVTSPTKDELPDTIVYTTDDIKALFKGCYVKVVYEDELDRCWRITPRSKST